jgi:transposase
MTIQEKYEFTIENWDAMTISQIADALDVKEFQVSQWVARMRKQGINLRRKKGSGSVDWDKLKAKANA